MVARAGDARAAGVEYRDDPVVRRPARSLTTRRIASGRTIADRHSAARRHARPERAPECRVACGPRISGPTTGARTRATSSMLAASMTFGSVVPTGVAVLKSGMPEGVARSTARHSGRLARTRREVSRAWTRSTSAAGRAGSVRASDLQRRDRQAQLGVDRGCQGAREVERRLLGLLSLLPEQGMQRDARHQRQRQDRHRREQQQAAAQGNRALRHRRSGGDDAGETG